VTQLSRPFQLALVAVGLFVLVWFVALRGHVAGSGGSSSPVAASSSSAPSSANPAAPTSIYHGKAPGVEGLTRAIDKAHGAVATSEQNAKQLQEKSARASSQSTQAATPGSGSVAGAQPSRAVTQTSAKTVTRPAPATSKRAGAPSAGATALPARQVTVEKELKQGKVVVLLFWSQKGADDVAVHTELQVLLAAHRQVRAAAHVPLVRRLVKAVGLELDKKIAVHYASASQVASFGSFTRTVQVYQTPTIVIVNKKGKTRTLTGLTDAYSIEQTIDEARHA
jgi:hypothetical protein